MTMVSICSCAVVLAIVSPISSFAEKIFPVRASETRDHDWYSVRSNVVPANDSPDGITISRRLAEAEPPPKFVVGATGDARCMYRR